MVVEMVGVVGRPVVVVGVFGGGKGGGFTGGCVGGGLELAAYCDVRVATEASTLVLMYRSAQAFPQPERDQAQQAVVAYIHSVIDDEWPALRAAFEAFSRPAASIKMRGSCAFAGCFLS